MPRSIVFLSGLALAAGLVRGAGPVAPSIGVQPAAQRIVAPAPACTSRHWITNWYAAPGDATLGLPPIEQTFRIQVRPLHAGSVARFRFSNRFGKTPVTFGSATVGKAAATGQPCHR